jgi:alkylation response protein AidB-like acyl-CoA dehydrogenase
MATTAATPAAKPTLDFALTPDQGMLVEATRSFLADEISTSEITERRHDPAGFSREYWQQGAALGWTALLVSPGDGGGSVSESAVRDLGLLAFELGRTAAPGPVGAASSVAAALSRNGSEAQKAELMPGVLDGSVIATSATAEPRPFDRLGAVGVTAARQGGEIVLSGRKAPVESGGQADVLLVTAKLDDGQLVQLLVPTGTAGVTVTPMQTLDLTRRFASVSFDRAAVPSSAVLGVPGPATEAEVERQLQIAITVQLFEVVGAMDRALEYTYQWLFDRYSFGRPLASYQALKHRFADMRAWLEAGAAIAEAAAQHVQDESDRAGELVSVGKSFLAPYSRAVLHECVQFHGGIGVTMEHDLQIFLRRVVLDSQLLGSVEAHRERLTAILEQREVNK